MSIAKKQALTAYTFLCVPLLFYLSVRFFPMLYAFFMGLTNWGLTAKGVRFIGLENFATIFNDPVFLKSIKNTLQYVLFGVPTVIILSLLVASQLSSISKLQGTFRLIYILPYITPVVATSWVWRWIFQPPPIGILNHLLQNIGLNAQGFLLDPNQALLTITTVNVWVELGYCVTIFVAGIQNIPHEYVEAARIDGASHWKIFTNVTLPLLLPITFFLSVMQSIQFMRIFTQVYNMSYQAEGGPLDSTKSVALYIYQTAFNSFRLGRAAAASLVLFVGIMGITLLQMKYFDRDVQY